MKHNLQESERLGCFCFSSSVKGAEMSAFGELKFIKKEIGVKLRRQEKTVALQRP